MFLNLYTGHLPTKILFQTVEKYQIYDKSPTSELKNFKRPKLIKLLQTPLPSGFNESIHHRFFNRKLGHVCHNMKVRIFFSMIQDNFV